MRAAALGGVGEQDAVEGRQQARRRRRLGVGPRRVGQVVERAAVLVLEALEVRAEALERLAHRRRAPADPARHVLGARRPEGPQVAAHDLVERLVALRRAARARGREQGARRLRAPGAVGRRPHEGRPALERAPLELALAVELGRRERLGMVGEPLLDEGADLLAAARRPARVGPQLRQQLLDLGARLVVRAAPVVARRLGRDRRVGRVLARGDEVQRRAQQRAGDELSVLAAPRRRRSGSKPSTRDHSAAGGAGQYCACRAPTASTASTSGRSRRSSRPCRASSARLSAVGRHGLRRVAHAGTL